MYFELYTEKNKEGVIEKSLNVKWIEGEDLTELIKFIELALDPEKVYIRTIKHEL